MKISNFNKLGDTSFRYGNQVLGYINVLNFLYSISEERTNFDIRELDLKYIYWCKEQGLYNYKKNKKEINRFSLIRTLLSSLNVISVEKAKCIINRNEIENILDDPYKNIFNKLYNNVKWFRETINFSKTFNSQIKIEYLIFAMLIYDEQESIEYLYNKISNGYKSVLEEMALKVYDEEITLKKYLGSFRKPPKIKDIINKLIASKENGETISTYIIEELLKSNQFNNIIITNRFTLDIGKKKNISSKIKKEIALNYLNSNSIESILIDLEMSRLYELVFNEYSDLNERWFNDFGLVVENKFNKERINIIEQKINYSYVSNIINQYPWNINTVKQYLTKIQVNDYSFKDEDKNLEEIANSVLAEYFVNVYISMLNEIPANDFSTYSRTKLLPGTIYPVTCAPGKGPDMFYVKNNKLMIFETTIHPTYRSIRNNETYNVVDHIKRNSLQYIPKSIKVEEINSSEIMLITNLNNLDELIMLKNDIENNISKEINYCFNNNDVIVTNFELLASEEK